MVMPTSIVGQASAPCCCGAGRILGMRVGSLHQALERHVAVAPLGKAFPRSQETELVTRIFHRGKVSIQLVAVSNAKEHTRLQGSREGSVRTILLPAANQSGIILCHSHQRKEAKVCKKKYPISHQTNVTVLSSRQPHPAGSCPRSRQPLLLPQPPQELPPRQVRLRVQGNVWAPVLQLWPHYWW